MLTRLSTCIVSVALAPSLFSAAAFSADVDVRIERLVPQDTLLVGGIDNWKELEARARRSPLWGLWETPEVQKLWKSFLDDTEKKGGGSFDDALAKLGLTRDKLVAPQGAVMSAIFLELDQEKAVKVPAFLAYADFGDNADKAKEMFDAALDKLAKDGGIRIEERELRGRTVRTIPVPKPPADAAGDAADDEEDEDFDMGGGMPDMMDTVRQIERVHLCRDGKRFMLSSSIVALEDALEVVDGQKLTSPLSESKDFVGARKQIGDDVQAWQILLTEPAQPLVKPLLAAAGPAAMAMPFIGQLFGDIRAYSFGVALSPGAAAAAPAAAGATDKALAPAGEVALETTVGIYIPAEKVGLMKLIADGRPKGDVPAHVGPDTVGFSRMNVRFAGVMPLVSQVVKGLPPMFAEQIEMQLQQVGPALEKGLAELGPEIYVSTTQGEPLTVDSRRTAVAIRSARPDAVRPMIDLVAPAMGLQPQDFVGQTIYADEFASEAIGLGSGWLVVGAQAAVEGVLRSAGQKDLPSLADDKLFKRSIAALSGGDLVGWGWSNTIAGWKYQQVASKAMVEEMRGMLEDEDLQIAGFSIEDLPMGSLYAAITPELLAKYVGPSVWSLRSTSDGFVYRSLVLGPE